MTNILSIIIASIIPIIIFTYRVKKYFSYPISIIIGSVSAIIISMILNLSIRDITTTQLIIGMIISIFINFLLLNGKVNMKYIIRSIAVLILFLTISIVELIPIIIFNLDIHNLTLNQNIYLTLFTDIIFMITLLIIYYKDLKNDFKSFKENFYDIFESSFKYWFIGLIIMFVSNILISLFIKQAVAGNENSIQTMIDAKPFIILICAGFIAPFTEELTFRKTFMDLFKNKWLFVLTSGILFGLMHVAFSFTSLYDFVYVIPYAALGISFALMVYKTNNIFSSIMMHTIHNTVVVLFSILTGMIIV